MLTIRAFESQDWAAVWSILQAVCRRGDSYPYPVDVSEAEAHALWIDIPTRTYVVVTDTEQVIGSYYLKPNQPGLGAHVCNCGYIVAEHARRQGVAAALCEHSQATARENGFRAMQYNLVVSTNEVAVRLWKRQGFAVVGTLPGAFRHRDLDYVDALVMYKALVD